MKKVKSNHPYIAFELPEYGIPFSSFAKVISEIDVTYPEYTLESFSIGRTSVNLNNVYTINLYNRLLRRNGEPDKRFKKNKKL